MVPSQKSIDEEISTNTWALGSLRHLEHLKMTGDKVVEGFPSRVKTVQRSLAEHHLLSVSCVVDNCAHLFVLNSSSDLSEIAPSLSVDFDAIGTIRFKWKREDQIDLDLNTKKCFLLALDEFIQNWIIELPRSHRTPLFQLSNGHIALCEPTFEYKSLTSEGSIIEKNLSFQLYTTLTSTYQLLVSVTRPKDEPPQEMYQMNTDALTRMKKLWNTSKLMEPYGEDLIANDLYPRLVEKTRMKREDLTINTEPKEKEMEDTKEEVDEDEKEEDEETIEMTETKISQKNHYDVDEESTTPLAPDLSFPKLNVSVEFPDATLHRTFYQKSRKVQQLILKVKRSNKRKKMDDLYSVLGRTKQIHEINDPENPSIPFLSMEKKESPNYFKRTLQQLSIVVEKETSKYHGNLKQPVFTTQGPFNGYNSIPDMKPLNSLQKLIQCPTTPPETIEMPTEESHSITDIAGGLRLFARHASAFQSNFGSHPSNEFSRDQCQHLKESLSPVLESFTKTFHLNENSSKWLGLKDYFMKWIETDESDIKQIELVPPMMVVSKADTLIQVTSESLCEWSLRSYQPSGSMKNIAYTILSPSNYVSRVIDHVKSIGSTYMNCSLGRHIPMDLKKMKEMNEIYSIHHEDGIIELLNNNINELYGLISKELNLILNESFHTIIYFLSPWNKNKNKKELMELYGIIGKNIYNINDTNQWNKNISFISLYPQDFLFEYGISSYLKYQNNSFYLLNNYLPYHLDIIYQYGGYMSYKLYNGFLFYSISNKNGSIFQTDLLNLKRNYLIISDILNLLEIAFDFINPLNGPLIITSIEMYDMIQWKDAWKSIEKKSFIIILTTIQVLDTLQFDSIHSYNEIIRSKKVGILLPHEIKASDGMERCQPNRQIPYVVHHVATLQSTETSYEVSMEHLISAFHDHSWLLLDMMNGKPWTNLPWHVAVLNNIERMIENTK